MSKRLFVSAMVVAMFFSVGCVSQKKYDKLQQAYGQRSRQVADLRGRIDQLSGRIQDLREGTNQDAARAQELAAERQRLLQQLEQLQGKYETLANREPVALPRQVDRALRDFASQHDDLVNYDPERGMVKFRSDLTFALGSAKLKSDAERTLSQLSGILNRGVASQYEVRVVGHTDAVPISRPSTRAKHPTNWHLSTDRAIAVRQALDEAGVPAVRTSVAGYGKYRPLVQNSRGGAEGNRRVEIYLVEMGEVNRDYITPSGRSSRAAASRPEKSGSAASARARPSFPLK